MVMLEIYPHSGYLYQWIVVTMPLYRNLDTTESSNYRQRYRHCVKAEPTFPNMQG